ncbi:hypothetical protein MRX96_039024 [Rhipicephalus microplus]
MRRSGTRNKQMHVPSGIGGGKRRKIGGKARAYRTAGPGAPPKLCSACKARACPRQGVLQRCERRERRRASEACPVNIRGSRRRALPYTHAGDRRDGDEAEERLLCTSCNRTWGSAACASAPFFAPADRSGQVLRR